MQLELPASIDIDTKRIFFTLLKIVLLLIGILVASFLLVVLVQGQQHKGLLYFIFIIVSILIVFRLYLKNIEIRPRLKREREPELYGTLESTAAMIWRASEGYDYSKEKLEAILSKLYGTQNPPEGMGDHYLDELEKILEEI
jgi:hypothetical protein